MKIVEHFALKKFPFILIAILFSAFITYQEYSIHTTESKAEQLSKQVRAAKRERAKLAEPPSPEAAAFDAIPASLKELGVYKLGRLRRLETIAMNQKIDSMPPEEILRILDDIEESEMIAGRKLSYIRPLVASLLKRDIRTLLEYISRSNRYETIQSKQIVEAFSIWAETNSADAISWLDGWISQQPDLTKTLNYTDSRKIDFESALISALFKVDKEKAKDRFVKMTNSEAQSMLYRIDRISPLDTSDFVEIARYLPERDANSALGHRAVEALKSGLESASSEIDEMNLSQDERNYCIDTVANRSIEKTMQSRELTTEDIDEIRQWSSEQGINDVDELTGKILGRSILNEHMETDYAIKLVEHYSESGNDSLLIGFLENRGCCAGEPAANLVPRITNSAAREKWNTHFRIHHSY